MLCFVVISIWLLTTSCSASSITHQQIELVVNKSEHDVKGCDPGSDERDTAKMAELPNEQDRPKTVFSGVETSRGHAFRIVYKILYGGSGEKRRKRSTKIVGTAVLIGLRAAKSLLNGAIEIIDGGPIRLYEKSGSYQQALKDFASVRPKEVKVLPGVVYGKIGDRTIVVRRKGWLNKPTIDINKKNNNPANAGFTNDADTIIYKD